MKSNVLMLAFKELQTLPEKEQEYFANWITDYVDKILTFKKEKGHFPKVRKRVVTKRLKVFVENLCIKHDMRIDHL